MPGSIWFGTTPFCFPSWVTGAYEGIKILASTLWRLTPISKRFNSNCLGVCTEKTLKTSHLLLPCSGNSKGDTFPTFLLLALWGLVTFNRCYQFDPANRLCKWTCSIPFWLIPIWPLCLLRNAHGKLLCLPSTQCLLEYFDGEKKEYPFVQFYLCLSCWESREKADWQSWYLH